MDIVKKTIKIISLMPRWECFESKINALTIRYTRQNGLVSQASIRTDIDQKVLAKEIDNLMRDMLYGKKYTQQSKGNKRRARQRAKRKINNPSASPSALEAFQL